MSCRQRSGALTWAASPWDGHHLLLKLIPSGSSLLGLIHTKFSLKTSLVSDWKIRSPACMCIKNPSVIYTAFSVIKHWLVIIPKGLIIPARCSSSLATPLPREDLCAGAKGSVLLAEQNGNFSAWLPGIDGSHVLSRAELNAHTTERGLVRRSITRFLSRIKKLF